MKYSNLYVKTQKETPGGEDSKNAELLIKAGFIRKEVAGAYSFLPLGLRVLRKIENIVREEMNNVGAVEILMPALASKEHWTQTDRWDNMGCLYKFETAAGHEVALAPTHEETVTPLVQQFARSWKDFPLCTYQIQTKFRNEPRAKSGLLRGREFLMKDAYSFHTNQEDFETYYELQKKAYTKIYERLGMGDITHIVAASGGDFSKHSHEFQTECETGEDTVFYSKKKDLYFNKELVEGGVDPETGEKYESFKAIEVGNIFPLATKFSDAFNFRYTDENGKEQPIIMGCYGIGISRIMGALAEIFNDDKGLKWPIPVAPFQVYLAAIGKDDKVYKEAEALYDELTKAGIEVLYDDRQDKKIGPGQKFADHELLGIPCRLVMSENTAKEGVVEYVDRETRKTEKIKRDKVVEFLKK